MATSPRASPIDAASLQLLPGQIAFDDDDDDADASSSSNDHHHRRLPRALQQQQQQQQKQLPPSALESPRGVRPSSFVATHFSFATPSSRIAPSSHHLAPVVADAEPPRAAFRLLEPAASASTNPSTTRRAQPPPLPRPSGSPATATATTDDEHVAQAPAAAPPRARSPSSPSSGAKRKDKDKDKEHRPRSRDKRPPSDASSSLEASESKAKAPHRPSIKKKKPTAGAAAMDLSIGAIAEETPSMPGVLSGRADGGSASANGDTTHVVDLDEPLVVTHKQPATAASAAATPPFTDDRHSSPLQPHEPPQSPPQPRSMRSPRSSLSSESANTAAVTPPPATYRRQSMLKSGSSQKGSWRQKNKSATPEVIAEAIADGDADAEGSGSSRSARGGEGKDGGGGGEGGVADHDDDNDELTFILPELTKDGEEASGRVVRETWPVDHVMLLYMLSRYAVCARTVADKETWIRQIPLLVLMYEGIAAKVLNFDYAPAALVIAQEGKPKRIWMNTTQDGKSAIDDLREANLINGLKLSTRDYHSVTAFQVSLRGLELLAQVSKELKAKVDSFIYAPKPYRHELLKIRYIPIADHDEPEEAFDFDGGGAGAGGGNGGGPSWTFQGSDKSLTGSGGGNNGGGATTAAAGGAATESEFNEEGRFMLESIGYYRYSEVTETEDVSYVSSPFVPQCVRGHDAYQPLSSNAHRAHEAASGQSNIRDTLSEAIVLANPVCLVGEWIPFGSNQIVALNERLGSMDRCQGGLFTSLIDDRPTDTQFEVPPGLTQVRILDYDPVRFINFEAEINFPEDDGIVQLENFGIHLNVDGTIFYGIRVEAILDKLSQRISVDLLSRLLVDIHQDSSEIMDDLLSAYQNSLLDMVFLGDIGNRGKFNMIMADQIDPFMPGLEYMDRGDYENELKQVLGDIHCAYDIGDDSVLIVGREGMLVAGAAARRHEKVFVAYFSLLCREMFLRSFFTRIFVLEELLKHVRELIFRAKEDPTHLGTIRARLNQATSDLILFTDTLGYLLESLEFVKIPQKAAAATLEEEEIFSYLDLQKQHHDILLRARDLEKLVHGAKYEVVNLRQMAEVLNTAQLEDIFKTVEGNTKALADASIVVKRSGASLELIQLLLAGSFALTLLDRVPGGSLNITPPDWVVRAFAEPIIDVPLLFFALNVLWMLAGVALVHKRNQRRHRRREIGRRILRLKINKPLDVEAFETFLGTRALEQQESVCQAATEIRRVMWQDVKDMSVTNGVKAAGFGFATKEPQTLKQRIVWWWRKKLRALRPMAAAGVAGTSATTGLAVNAVAPNGNGGSGSGANAGAAAATHLSGAVAPKPEPMLVEVEYDSRHGFLLFVTFHFHTPEDKGSSPEPLWTRVREWWRRKTERKRRRRPTATLDAATGGGLKRSVNDTTATTVAVDQSAKTVAPPTTTTTAATASPLALNRDEHELVTWFAWTLKNHKVITHVETLLSVA